MGVAGRAFQIKGPAVIGCSDWGCACYVTNLDRNVGVHSDDLGVTDGDRVLGWKGKGWSSHPAPLPAASSLPKE